MQESTHQQDGEVTRSTAGDVKARAVTIRQGGARSISAERVDIRQGGAARLQAGRVKIIQGGIGLASAERIHVTAGSVGAALGDRMILAQTATSIAAARKTASLEQSAGRRRGGAIGERARQRHRARRHEAPGGEQRAGHDGRPGRAGLRRRPGRGTRADGAVGPQPDAQEAGYEGPRLDPCPLALQHHQPPGGGASLRPARGANPGGCGVHRQGIRVCRAPHQPGGAARGHGRRSPLCFTGHLDVVPLGARTWTRDAFAGEIDDGRLYGRGSSDMKSGVAAFVIAVTPLARHLRTSRAWCWCITAGEETFCDGARHLARLDGALGQAGAHGRGRADLQLSVRRSQGRALATWRGPAV